MTVSHTSRWLKHGAYSLFNRISIVIFGFLNIFFMVRMLPQQEIGIWSLFVSVTTLLELLRNGFIRNPMIAHVVSASNEEERGTLITASLIIHCALTGGMAVLLILGAVPLTKFWNAPQLDILFYIYIFRSIALIPALHFEYLQQAKAQFVGIFFGIFTRLAPLALYIIVKFFFEPRDQFHRDIHCPIDLSDCINFRFLSIC